MKTLFIILGVIAIIIIGGAVYLNLASPKTDNNNSSSDDSQSATSVGEKVEPGTATEDNAVLKEDPRVIVEKASEGKIIAMVIAFKDFRDEEYFVPKELFTIAGALVKTVSTQKGMASGADGGQVAVDFTVSEINVDAFDAVVFVGGPGTFDYLDKPIVYNLAKDAVAKKKVVAAICAAPAVLANAGVLQGKQATVWTSSMDKSLVEILEDNGATYVNKSVVTDGLLVTGSGPEAADPFGMAVIEALMNL